MNISKNLFKSRTVLLYVMAISMMFSFSSWISLLNNFAVEVSSFNGEQIGILQSLREIPGFLAFTVVLVILIVSQQRLEYIGLLLVFTSYAFVENLYFAYFLYVIDHLLFSMAIALKTYFQKIADPKDIATASAVSFTINHIAAVILPASLGLVWLYSHSLVFLIGTLIALSSFILSFLIPKEPKQGYETTLVKV